VVSPLPDRQPADPRQPRVGADTASILRAPAGDVLLVLAAGGQLSAYVGAAVGEIGFLRGIWRDGSRRLAWLEDYAASVVGRRRPAGARPPRKRLDSVDESVYRSVI
jgi:hypothetical protein